MTSPLDAYLAEVERVKLEIERARLQFEDMSAYGLWSRERVRALLEAAEEIPTLLTMLQRAREGLERIEAMSGVPGACACGRPNGIPALKQCANSTLAALDRLVQDAANAR